MLFKRFCGTLGNLSRITDWGGLNELQCFKMIDHLIKTFFAGRTKRLWGQLADNPCFNIINAHFVRVSKEKRKRQKTDET